MPAERINLDLQENLGLPAPGTTGSARVLGAPRQSRCSPAR